MTLTYFGVYTTSTLTELWAAGNGFYAMVPTVWSYFLVALGALLTLALILSFFRPHA